MNLLLDIYISIHRIRQPLINSGTLRPLTRKGERLFLRQITGFGDAKTALLSVK